MRKLHWIGLALIVAPLAFAACGGDDTGTPAGTGGGGTGGSTGTGGGTGGTTGTGGGTGGTTGTGGGTGGTTGTGGAGTGGARPDGGTGGGGTGGTPASDASDRSTGAGGDARVDSPPGTGGGAGAPGDAARDAAGDARDSSVITDAASAGVCLPPGYAGGSAGQVGRTCAQLCTDWFAVCRTFDGGEPNWDTNFYGANQAACLAICNAYNNTDLCCRADHANNAITTGMVTVHCPHVTGTGPCAAPTPGTAD